MPSPTTRRSSAGAARHVNTLRLWSARAPDPLALETFNRGDHVGALAARARANAISQILYPSDETPAGQELRLRQEYFFSSASLQDLLHRHIRQYGDLHCLPDKCAIQLNDTHPAIVVAELMRLLVDEHGMPWADGVADHQRHHLATPTTRCCPRRWRAGRCR